MYLFHAYIFHINGLIYLQLFCAMPFSLTCVFKNAFPICLSGAASFFKQPCGALGYRCAGVYLTVLLTFIFLVMILFTFFPVPKSTAECTPVHRLFVFFFRINTQRQNCRVERDLHFYKLPTCPPNKVEPTAVQPMVYENMYCFPPTSLTLNVTNHLILYSLSKESFIHFMSFNKHISCQKILTICFHYYCHCHCCGHVMGKGISGRGNSMHRSMCFLQEEWSD